MKHLFTTEKLARATASIFISVVVLGIVAMLWQVTDKIDWGGYKIFVFGKEYYFDYFNHLTISLTGIFVSWTYYNSLAPDIKDETPAPAQSGDSIFDLQYQLRMEDLYDMKEFKSPLKKYFTLKIKLFDWGVKTITTSRYHSNTEVHYVGDYPYTRTSFHINLSPKIDYIIAEPETTGDAVAPMKG